MKLSVYACISILALSILTDCSQLEFVEYKDRDHLSTAFFSELQTLFNPDIYIETGTMNGGTTRNAAPSFSKIYTVELNKNLFETSRKNLARFKNISVYQGRSFEVFEKLLPTLSGKTVFWLDAHYSGPGTSLSYEDESNAEAVTAIRKELSSIKNYCTGESIILIDDIRGFGTEINGTEFMGCWAYPSLQEVKKMLLDINPNFTFKLLKDIFIAYDKKYDISTSPVLDACTASRLYDGTNLSNEQLISFERTISQAQGQEKAAITDLYRKMTDCKDPMFLHDLWYGLISLRSNQFEEARSALLKVCMRQEHLDKCRRPSDRLIPYEHGRIWDYLEKCTVKN